MATTSNITLVIFLLSTCIKMLFLPAYKSTDFEVHRNWLAITHSLPVSKWYYEDTSEWTLDYPPFFAWFEWLLSKLAVVVDSEIVKLNNLYYSSWSCILFQRFSVMATDLVLLYAVQQYCVQLRKKVNQDKYTVLLGILLLMNYGLFIVDHIHFQYNGMLFGILLLSVVRIYQERYLEGAFWFACLLNLKHLFLYVAPAYFVFLLKNFCFSEGRHGVLLKTFSIFKFLKLGILVIFVFLMSFGPFIAMGQLGQVLSRLFPFKRGLCHAYWAANFWALYNVADKMASILGKKFGLWSVSPAGGMTSGLVGEMEHQVLPSIPPWCTILLTLVAILPCLVRLWTSPSPPRDFLRCLVLCGFASFLFGWHVHEKAIMMVTIPLCLLAVESKVWARCFTVVTFAGHIGLFPLLFQPAELLIKTVMFVCYSLVTLIGLFIILKPPKEYGGGILSFLTAFERSYLALLCFTQVYCCFLHPLLDSGTHYPFLPLLLTSVSCSFGVIWSWAVFYHDFIFAPTSTFKPHTE